MKAPDCLEPLFSERLYLRSVSDIKGKFGLPQSGPARKTASSLCRVPEQVAIAASADSDAPIDSEHMRFNHYVL